MTKRKEEEGKGKQNGNVKRVRVYVCLCACTFAGRRALVAMVNERGDPAEWKKDRCEGSGEQEKRACFIKCVARGKSTRQFSGAKAAADNARPRLKQSVTLFKSLYRLFERCT